MRNISIGIEVGSSKVRIVVAEILKGEKYPKVIGIGESETEGMRQGYIINPSLTALSIKKAVQMAEKSAEIKIRKASVALGVVTLAGEKSTGSCIVSKADNEVTFLDVEKAIEDSENNLDLNNKKIIKTIPLNFKLDGNKVQGKPEGMKGAKLEVETLFITCLNQHFENLLDALASAGIEPSAIIPGNISASNIVLSQKEKIFGVVLANIGYETLTVSVFDNDNITSLQTFNIGTYNIINDIALGMKVSLERAEELLFDSSNSGYQRRELEKLDDIIKSRVSDFFTVIERHLRRINRNGILPAGIVFIGGGAKTINLEAVSVEKLALPSKVGTTGMFSNTVKTKLRDPSWFTVLGLLNTEKEDDFEYSASSYAGLWKNLKNTIKSSIKQLMP